MTNSRRVASYRVGQIKTSGLVESVIKYFVLVNQPSFIGFVGQKGLIVLLNLLVGNFADQVVGRLARLIFFSFKKRHITEK